MMRATFSLFVFLLFLSGCQSLEVISIDYMQPAELSFPAQLRRVAIVNNTGVQPDTSSQVLIDGSQPIGNANQATAYTNGDAAMAIETMAQEIANQNYFDEVVICDSALRARDILPRESTLTQEEVENLTSGLRVDMLIALENLPISAKKVIAELPEYGVFRGTTDVKVYPLVKFYLPERARPIAAIQPVDSIFWETFGHSVAETHAQLISDERLIKESSEFAGIVPVRHFIPSWVKKDRYLYSGGTSLMRDAMVYVRENRWEEAYRNWKTFFDNARSDKKKMYAAQNIAVYHELKDSLNRAQEWALKAQEFARKAEKLPAGEASEASLLKQSVNYRLITLYLAELKQRYEQMSKLDAQMSRFKRDF